MMSAPLRPGLLSRTALVGVLFAVVCASVGCSDSFRRSGPSDQVSSGTLCLPASVSCPSSTELIRDDLVGANQVDYQVTNLADQRTTVTIRVRTPTADPVDAADAEELGDAQSSTLVEVTERLDPNSTALGRITQDQLTTRDNLVLAVFCQDCDIELIYALTNEPLECRTDDDCTGPWVCLEDFGRCVECESSADCEAEQTCSLQTNSCEPPLSGGCQTATGSANYGIWPILIAIAAIMLLGASRRRWSAVRHLLTGFLVVASICALGPNPAQAAEPPKATFGLGIGPRWFTGELAGVTKRGIGLQFDQELRWRYFGAAVRLGTRYHLTTQDPPPLSRELQVYTVAAGPRAYYALGDFSFMASAEYQHVGLVSNSLVRLTGPQLNYGSAGGSLGVRYTLSALEVGVRGGFYPIFGLEGSLVSVDITVRLSVK